MTAPNFFLPYVCGAQEATAFYSDLFELKPAFTSPRHVAFAVAPGVLFAVWTGRAENATPQTPRASEVGLMLLGGPGEIDSLHDRWAAKGVTVVQAPPDEVFGRTFVASDPDGNLIRVSAVD